MKRYEYNYGKNPEGTLSTISGYATETTNFGETAFGILNKSTRDEENFTTPEVVSSSTATLFSVGNGTDHDSRKNIIELKADGTVYINGVGQYDGTNPGESTNIADEFQGIHDDITGLNEDVDRIDNTIESIHISEDDENLIYTLLVDGQERGTINIPRDQFLKDVSYNEETNNLEFIFIVRDENNEEVEKRVNIDMTDLEDIYSAGDGLNLENKQFSVKVDADTQPYIEVSSNGVKVIGIDEKFNTVNQNVTDLTNRVTTAESDIDAIQDELANLEGSGEGSVQDQINDALQSYLPLSGGTLTGSITFESEPAGNVGDALLYDKQANKLIVVPTTDDMDTQYPANDYEPIGIVVIPASHDVYGTGECGVMSLRFMSTTTPDEGSQTIQSVRWGAERDIDDIPYGGQVPIGNNEDGSLVYRAVSTSGRLPSDAFNYIQCQHDSDCYYSEGSVSNVNTAPSPYLTDDSRNPYFYDDTTYPYNCFSDFGGLNNSKTLWNLSTGQLDWKTNSTITNNYSEGYYPAACCCWRYHTNGTQQGDWYLPAIGELGYIIPKLNLIHKTLSILKTVYNQNIFTNIQTGSSYTNSMWSSTIGEHSSLSDYKAARTISANDGSVGVDARLNNYHYAVAFTRIKPESDITSIIISGKSDQDLLNAAGGTTSISDILAEVPSPDLSPYATKEEVGSNIYTDSNYLGKETNLTDAVVQLDEEIKATNDNLALEHANAEATYAKKSELRNYLPLSGGTLNNGSSIYFKHNLASNKPELTLDTSYISLLSKVDYPGINTYLGMNMSATAKSGYLFRAESNNGYLEENGVIGIFLEKSSSGDTYNPYFAIGKIINPTESQIYEGSPYIIIRKTGISLYNKTSNDLLNAGGSTTSISDITTQVQAAIVDSAPETLDTLNELAAALGDDPNFATTVTNQIAQKASISGLPNNIVPAILPTPIYSDTYVRIAHQYCAKDSSSGTFGTAQNSFTQINAATSTTAGVLTAEDFNKLQFITAVTDTAVHGIKQITFNSTTTDTAKIYTQVDQNAGEGIYNTTLVLEVTDDASETADADSIDAIELRTTGLGGQNADTIVRVTDILKSRNPNSGILERVANISELPTVQSGQTGTNTNYVYSSAADESYRVLSDISCTRTGDVVKLQGRTWGMASNSSLDLVTLPLASSSMAGLISTADKSKLDQISITQGDIVASGFRITDGTANEVLTADGDSNTLKTINGQTLLGSGDVDMSEFALKTDLDDYLSAGGGTVAGDISVESIEDTNTLTITNTGINISGKTNNDLIAAAGGTISIDDLKTQIISDLSAQVSTLQTQITVLTSRIEALETSLTKQEV